MLRKDSFDITLRLRLRHRAGELARVARTIADAEGVIGDVTTERLAEMDSVRLVTVEATDEEQAARVVSAVRSLPDVEVLAVVDRVLEWHRGGKLRMVPRAEVTSIRDLRYVYTPGVARVCRAIEADAQAAWDLTGVGRTVGIFTNGTRVLGLGNIGPLASLPVMEGKAMLYSQLVGLSAIPMLIDEQDPREFVRVVERVSIGCGVIHLEDIRTPDCFEIERLLIDRLSKPVFHDDQHGTATAALAALLAACRRVGMDPKSAVLGQIGLGAAGHAIAKLAKTFGVARVLVTDPNADAMAKAREWGGEPCDLPTLMGEAQIVIATTGRAGLISPASIRPGQIVFALSNPYPEIAPDVALAAGAAFAGDGRSVNNALAYPGIIRGVLEARARYVTPAMMIAAARAIASCARPDELVPSPLEPRVHRSVAEAVRGAAGLEKIALSR
jgi:malate dehydrogenase (oxaloacetate-decarboxylating)